MEVKVENVEKNLVKLTIEVENEKFENAMEKAYRKNKSRFVIPGFRKGKAPRKVVENYYGEGILYEDAMEGVFPDAYKEAIEQEKINPVSQPELDVEQIGKDKNLIFTAEVWVKPEVEVKDYFGVEVEKAEFEVTDEQVDAKVEKERENNARMITIEDRPIKEDDIVDIDYKGFVDGEEFEGGTDTGHELTIGSGQFIPGFEDQLIGKEVGEECELNVTFPEDYNAEDLKGKEAKFEVKINSIKKKELPELDDEFAKDVSEFDTLKEYKEDVKAKLEKQSKDREKMENENRVINKIVETVDIDVPDSMIDSQVDTKMKEFEMRLQYQGMKLDQYAQMLGMDMNTLKTQFRPEAKKDVITQLVIEKISELENIEATDEDVDKEIEKYSKSYNQSVEDMKKTLRDSDIDSIKKEVVARKTVELLAQKAEFVKEKETKNEEEKEEQKEETENDKE